MSSDFRETVGNPTIVRTQEMLHKVIAKFEDVPLIAIDTESNSLYAYQEQVCLIQVTVPAISLTNGYSGDFIIDPLVIEDLSPLGKVLANPDIELVFHAAEYDIMCLKRDYGFEFANVFDTYIAARTLGYQRVGLGSILEDRFDVHLDKRFQQADWSKRPISDDQLFYAQMDTHFLPALRDILAAELTENGYLEEALEYCEQMGELPAAHKEFDPEGFWRIRTPHDLSGREMAILKELYLWREVTAEQRNLPPFKVLQDAELVKIALADPMNIEDLQRIRGISTRKLERYSKAILHTVNKAYRKSPPKPKSSPSRSNHGVVSRYEALHDWRKKKARSRGVESDIILSKQALWALAYHAPSSVQALEAISEIGSHRRGKYGAELIKILLKHHQKNNISNE
jgi:ribonuclease D